jgi:hypothetical protein
MSHFGGASLVEMADETQSTPCLVAGCNKPANIVRSKPSRSCETARTERVGRLAAAYRSAGPTFGLSSAREWTLDVMSEEGTVEMRMEMRVARATRLLTGDFEGGRKSAKDESRRVVRSGRW